MHIPFCRRLCPYCDFAVSVEVDIPHREYGEAVIEELQIRHQQWADHSVATVYFGGGTPSLLAPEQLAAILARIDTLFGLGDGVEVTMEANPNEVSEANLDAWRRLGINRLSIGCQSFQPRHLHALRRNHSAMQALQAVRRALRVMNRVSIDVMFAGPSQSMREWEADLEVVQRLVREDGLDHVSGYDLTIEEGTTFWIRRKQGILRVADHDTAAQMLRRLVEACNEVGLKRYEVSNFSVPGGESEHNSSYWRGRPYLGVGVGAHSLRVCDEAVVYRRANPRSYDAYMKSPGEPKEQEDLSAVEHLAERLFLGARTTFGVDMKELRHRFGAAVEEQWFDGIERVLRDLVAREFMDCDGEGKFWPTDRGLNFSDSLAEWLFEAATEEGSGTEIG